jgi:predicted HTH domain antitoxin
MSNKQIIELFDSSNITMAELSRITGYSIRKLKGILCGK